MKRMLFNATQAEELRVAIVDGQNLIDIDIELTTKEQRKGWIYKGVITCIEPSLEACFINYGSERHGFLPFKEIALSQISKNGSGSRKDIKDLLSEGQELIVQIEKEERGSKGAALTTFISLAGRYLVLMPTNSSSGGVSRRISGKEREELRDAMAELDVTNNMGLIARTAAIGRQTEELQWDLNYLTQLWQAIEGVSNNTVGQGALLIYQESSLVVRAIRDYFQPEIIEILVDTPEIFEQAKTFIEQVMPESKNKVKLYNDDVPLFSRFQIEHQIETAFGRQVTLPSGGEIVIDHTEALVAVDVNSSRSTRGGDIEETAYRTNLEAAEELARQLRLRDLGGLIVIDFIDMENTRNQRGVEECLKQAVRFDRARLQIGRISRFGLVELSRQRLRPALAETNYIPCPRCTGTGHIRSTESTALHILRILEEEAIKENTANLHAQVPVDIATFLLNEKRYDLQSIELRHRVNIILVPNVHLETPAHKINRVRHEDLTSQDDQDGNGKPSYLTVEQPGEQQANSKNKAENNKPKQEAAIKSISHVQPAPIVSNKSENAVVGLWTRVVERFKKKPVESEKPQANKTTGQGSHQGARNNNHRTDSRRDNRRRGRGNRGNGRDDHRTGQTANSSNTSNNRNNATTDSTHPSNSRQRTNKPRHNNAKGRDQRTHRRHDNNEQEGTNNQNQNQPVRNTEPSQQSQVQTKRQEAENINTSHTPVAAQSVPPTVAIAESAAPVANSTNNIQGGSVFDNSAITTTADKPAAPTPEATKPKPKPKPTKPRSKKPEDQAQSNSTEAAKVAPDATTNVSVETQAPKGRKPATKKEVANDDADASKPTKSSSRSKSPKAPARNTKSAAKKEGDLAKNLETSGLVMVQTSAQTTEQTNSPEKPSKTGRPARRRAATGKQDTSAEQLVMVETKSPSASAPKKADS